MRTFCKLAWTETKLFCREPAAAFFTLVLPVMMLLIFGAIYGNKPSRYFGGFGMADVSVPSYTAVIIASTGLLSLPIGLTVYRELGVLRRLKTTPAGSARILAAMLTVAFIMTALGMALLIVTGKLVYNLRFGGTWWALCVSFALSAFAFFAIGLAIAGVQPTARTAQVSGLIAFFPMIFLSGATIPRETFPGTLQRVSEFIPLTHAVTLMRGLWLGDGFSDHLKEVTVLVAILIVGSAISIRTFKWE